jgi:small-conductance mechanosensitive channel
MLLRSKIVKDVDMARFISKTAAMTVYSFIGITALGTLGVDTKPIIAGIGVTGFTVGFALKEIAANLLAGILLMFQRPFQKGQYLRVLSGAGLEGEVESIDSRYVLLKSKERGMIMIPSAVVYSNPILVFPKPPADAK